MKRVSFFLLKGMLFGWFLVACSQEELLPSLPSEPPEAVGTVRSVGEALAELDAVLDHLDAPTRSGGRRSCTVANMAVAGGGSATRGEGVPSLPDTLAYVVNFDGGEGFAVLGARRGLPTLYAVTESGTLDAERLSQAIAESYHRRTEPASSQNPTRSSGDGAAEIGLDIIPVLLADNIISDWGNTTGDVLIKETIEWKILERVVAPLVTTKWSQGYPFNAKCNLLPSAQLGQWYLDELQDRCAVGCVMVALGQVLACNRRPQYHGALMNGCGWDVLLSVSNYTNLEHYYYKTVDQYFASNPTAKQYCGYLAHFLWRLGQDDYCDARYGSGTGAEAHKALETLKKLDWAYYGNARLVSMSSNASEMCVMLRCGKPIFTRGQSQHNVGHAWVIDGYLEGAQVTTRWYRKQNGEVYDITTYVPQTLFHCNWGFLGHCDGYYRMQSLVTDPNALRDLDIDREGAENRFNADREGKDYSDNTQVILY